MELGYSLKLIFGIRHLVSMRLIDQVPPLCLRLRMLSRRRTPGSGVSFQSFIASRGSFA
jgi:hypothetical protein